MKIIRSNKIKNPASPIYIQSRLEKKPFRFSDLNRLAVPTKNGSTVLPFEEILFLKSNGNYTEIYCSNNKKILITKTLKLVASKLNHHFIRPHSSYVINLLHVVQFDKSNSIIELVNGKQIPVARSSKNEMSVLFEF